MDEHQDYDQPDTGGAEDVSEQEQPLYVQREVVEEQWIEPARWPKVVGIISIVLGGVSLACMGCGIGAQVMFGPMQQQMFTDGMPPAALSPPPLIFASAGVGAVVNLLLIIAGIVLIMRKPMGRTLHLAYAVLGLLSAALGTYAQLSMQAEITDWVKQNPDTIYSQEVGANAIGQVVGIVIGIIFGYFWPVFCLIWFGLAKRDSSEIQRGIQEVM